MLANVDEQPAKEKMHVYGLVCAEETWRDKAAESLNGERAGQDGQASEPLWRAWLVLELLGLRWWEVVDLDFDFGRGLVLGD